MSEIKPQQGSLGRMARTDASGAAHGLAGALDSVGRMAGALGRAVENNYAENQRRSGENYERARSIYLRGSYVPDLERAGSLEGVDEIRKNADQHLYQLGVEMLGGEENFNKYLEQSRRGALFEQELNVLTAAGKKRVSAAQAEALNAQKIALAAKEYAALPDNEDTRTAFKENLRREFSAGRVENAGPGTEMLSPAQTAALMEAFDKRALAELNARDYMRALNRVKAAPAAAQKELLDQKYFANLTPQQREHFLSLAERTQQAYDNTGKDPDIYSVVDTFAGVAEASPVLAAQLLSDLRANPSSRRMDPQLAELMGEERAGMFAQAVRSLRADKYKTALNLMEELAESPDMQTGRDAAAALAAAQAEFKLLTPGKNKKGHLQPVVDETGKELSGPALTRRLITARETLNGYLAAGTLVNDENKKAVLNMSREYAKRLGQEIAQQPEALYKTKRNLPAAAAVFFASPGYALKLAAQPGRTADETAVNLINEFAREAQAADEDRGALYYDFIRNAAARKINLESAEEAEKTRARELFEQVRMRYLQNRAGVPDGAYGTVILNGAAAAYAPNANAKLGAPAKGYDGYQFEILDGVEQLVKRNSAGEIVDIINAQHA